MVLCLFIFIGWMWISNKIWPPQPPPQAAPKKPEPAVQAPKPEPDKPEAAKPDGAKPDPSRPSDPVASYPEKPVIPLQSKYLDILLTNKGAGVRQATLYYPKDRAAS